MTKRVLFILIIFVIEQAYGNNDKHNLTLPKMDILKNIPVEGGYDNKNSTKNETTTKSTEKTVHLGREGIKVESTSTSAKPNATTEKIIPVSEASENMPKIVPTSEKIDVIGDSKIKARKGAPKYILENTTNTEKNTTTKSTTMKPKKLKPTVTIGSDDDENYESYRKIKNSKNRNSSNFKPDNFLTAKYKPDFVLPIVLTILLVPLIAIILSVFYKRCFEWYQHRHYRRMDFLIDGIYNN